MSNHNYTGTVMSHTPFKNEEGIDMVDVIVDGDWGYANFMVSPEVAAGHYAIGSKVAITCTGKEDTETITTPPRRAMSDFFEEREEKGFDHT